MNCEINNSAPLIEVPIFTVIGPKFKKGKLFIAVEKSLLSQFAAWGVQMADRNNNKEVSK